LEESGQLPVVHLCAVEAAALIIMVGMVAIGSRGFGYPRW